MYFKNVLLCMTTRQISAERLLGGDARLKWATWIRDWEEVVNGFEGLKQRGGEFGVVNGPVWIPKMDTWASDMGVGGYNVAQRRVPVGLVSLTSSELSKVNTWKQESGAGMAITYARFEMNAKSSNLSPSSSR